MDNAIKVFLNLVKAGLWGQTSANLNDRVDWQAVYKMAEEQSVVGLVLAGIEWQKTYNLNLNIPQEMLLQWIGEVQMLEQQNKEMNQFIAELIEKMRKADIYTLLVKGQGVAQCYERPLWRASGDVDLLLSDSNYDKAREFLLSISSENMPQERYSKHLGMAIDSWLVEIHGTLRTGLSGRIDKVVDDVQRDVFYGGNVRSWVNGKTTVFLPSPDNDVFFVFSHFIKHFYKEGMNLRQICDWCRLLWTFKDSLNYELLEKRVRKAGLMTEWKAFAALAVEYFGMPAEAMPLYDSKFKSQGLKLVDHIIKGSTGSVVRDTWSIFIIFPWHTLKFSPSIFFNVNGLKIKERLFMG